MRLLILLIPFLCLCGCNLPSAETAQAGDDSYLVEEDPLPESLPEPLDSEHSLQSSSPESGGFLGPDPFADEPSEPDEPDKPQGVKSSSSGNHSGVWVNYYYDSKHAGWAFQTNRLKGWANKRGLTVASLGEPNFRYAIVRLIDVNDPKIQEQIKRNLTYDGNKEPLFPTLVLMDKAGCDLCHAIGYITFSHLDLHFDARTPSKRKLGEGLMSLPPEEVKEIKYEPGASFHMECGPSGCRMVRH